MSAESGAESDITDHRLVVMWLWQFLRMTNQVWGNSDRRPNYMMSDQQFWLVFRVDKTQLTCRRFWHARGLAGLSDKKSGRQNRSMFTHNMVA